jgi:hypothetical protein
MTPFLPNCDSHFYFSFFSAKIWPTHLLGSMCKLKRQICQNSSGKALPMKKHHYGVKMLQNLISKNL